MKISNRSRNNSEKELNFYFIFIKMTKKKKIIFWIVGSLLVLASGLGIFFISKKSKTEYLTEDVKKGTISREVSVTGKLVTKEEINLNFETVGRIKEVLAFSGKEVVKGEVLASIEDAILNGEVEKAKLAWEKALADSGTNNDAVREAEQTKKNAENYLSEVEKLDKDKENSAEEAVSAAKKYYDDALAYYNKVVDENGANSSQAKSAKMTLTTAENSKDSAESNLEVVEKTSDLNQVSAKGTLDSAKDKLLSVQSDYARRSRDAVTSSAKIAYDQALTNLEKTALKAPVSGVVTKVNYKRGEVLGTAGQTNSFGKLIAKDFVLEADVPESDIAKIQLGQNADILFDAFSSDETFEAKVIEIEPASTVVQEVVYYKIKLSLDKFDARLKEGMSFDVNVKIARKEGVLMIPKRALLGDGNKVRVLAADGVTVKEVIIEKGMEGDDGLIEIVSGLQAGEKVIVLEKAAN